MNTPNTVTAFEKVMAIPLVGAGFFSGMIAVLDLPPGNPPMDLGWRVVFGLCSLLIGFVLAPRALQALKQAGE